MLFVVCSGADMADFKMVLKCHHVCLLCAKVIESSSNTHTVVYMQACEQKHLPVVS